MHVLSVKDYRSAALSKSYLTVTEIIMQSLKSTGQFKNAQINDWRKTPIIEKIRIKKMLLHS